MKTDTKTENRNKWQKGISGNPKGRPRGAKNKIKNRLHPTRAMEWTKEEWQAYHAKLLLQYGGNEAAVANECISLWSLLNPPNHNPALCAACGQQLLGLGGYFPVRIEGAFVHHVCTNQFLKTRLAEAIAGLRTVGLNPFKL